MSTQTQSQYLHECYLQSFCVYSNDLCTYVELKILIFIKLENSMIRGAAFTHMVSISSTFLRTNCLYLRHFGSFFLVTFWLWQKICAKNALVKCWWNWRMNIQIVSKILTLLYASYKCLKEMRNNSEVTTLIKWIESYKIFNKHACYWKIRKKEQKIKAYFSEIKFMKFLQVLTLRNS